MKALLSALVWVLRSKIGAELVSLLRDLIPIAMSYQMTGPEKKAAVLKEVEEFGGIAASQLSSASGTLLNLAIESLVALEKKL